MDRIKRVMTGGVLALAALVRPTGGRRLSRVVREVAIAGVVMMAACVPDSPGYSTSEHRRVEQVVAAFAPVLERYRQEHGEYPPTLQAAGIETPQTRYGPLQYRTWRANDGKSVYEVSFGDYDRNGFVASFSSLGGKWYLDT